MSPDLARALLHSEQMARLEVQLAISDGDDASVAALSRRWIRLLPAVERIKKAGLDRPAGR